MITTHHTYQLAAVFAYAAQRLRAEGDVAAADFAHSLYEQVVARAETASNVGANIPPSYVAVIARCWGWKARAARTDLRSPARGVRAEGRQRRVS